MLSVIICTFNRAGSLRKTISTLMKQEDCGNGNPWELLIVDNNSSDNTREVVENFMTDAGVPVRYIFEPRQGKSYALNTGIAKSRGEILAFTDDDTIVDKRWIASILEASDLYPHKGFGGKVIPLWPDSIPQWIQPAGPYSRPIVGGPIASHDRGDEAREYTEGMWVPIGGNMFFRKEVFEKYGGFRTDLGPQGNTFRISEDCEIGFRLRNHGEKLFYYPKAIVYHPVSPDKLSREYLLKYSWNAALQERERFINDCKPTIMRQVKSIINCALQLTKNLVKYYSSQDVPAAKMYYKYRVYNLSGQIYYYLLRRKFGSRQS